MSEEKQIFAQSEIGAIPLEWDVKTIKDVCLQEKGAIISGPFGSNIGRRFFVEKGIPVIRGNNLTTDFTKFVDDGFVFITNEKANELGTWAEQDDLVFTAAGTLGQVAIIPPKRKFDKYIISNKQLRARLDKRLIVPLFAFYWFQSKKMVDFINMRNTGSTIPLINLSVLKSLPLPVPPVREQKAIVKMLSTLDSKIENNQQMNKTLEAIGQALFKRWFVDFEFPNQEGKPYKSSGGEMVESDIGMIPKSWSIGSYNDLADVFSGKGLKRDCFAEDGEYPVLGANGEIGRTNSFLYNERLILTGRVGTLGQVYLTSGRVWVSDNVLISRPKSKENYYYAYFVLKSFDISSLNRGSTQPLVTQTDLKNQKAIIPDQKTMCTFEHVVTTLYAKVDQNHQQNILLSKIRDTLLPRLLSGKVRVPVLKESVEVQ